VSFSDLAMKPYPTPRSTNLSRPSSCSSMTEISLRARFLSCLKMKREALDSISCSDAPSGNIGGRSNVRGPSLVSNGFIFSEHSFSGLSNRLVDVLTTSLVRQGPGSNLVFAVGYQCCWIFSLDGEFSTRPFCSQ